jgi:hypothetical protein
MSNDNKNNDALPSSLAEVRRIAEMRAMSLSLRNHQETTAAGGAGGHPRQQRHHIVDDGTIPSTFAFTTATRITTTTSPSAMTRLGLAAILQEALDIVDDMDEDFYSTTNIMMDQDLHRKNASSFQKPPSQ